VSAAGAVAFPLGADLSTLAEIEHLFRELERELRQRTESAKLDILVNNAGIAPQASVEETSEAIFDQVFALNVKAPFFIMQKALPMLRDGARIINLSSALTRFAYPVEAACSMSKGAIEVMSLLLAKQLGSRGITVNSMAPGVIDTEMNARLLASPQGRDFAASLSVFNRVRSVDDVADVAAFLASSESRWITGQRIDVSGPERSSRRGPRAPRVIECTVTEIKVHTSRAWSKIAPLRRLLITSRGGGKPKWH